MHDAYYDIKNRIDQAPTWYDLHGVPRYGAPTLPRRFMGWIACQACVQLFYVSLADPVYIMNPGNRNVERVGDYQGDDSHLQLAEGWHYGDPPRHGCVGDTMNSIPQHAWDRWESLPSPKLAHEVLLSESHHQAIPEE